MANVLFYLHRCIYTLKLKLITKQTIEDKVNLWVKVFNI